VQDEREDPSVLTLSDPVVVVSISSAHASHRRPGRVVPVD